MAAVFTPDLINGGGSWDDGNGGKAVVDATGQLISVSPNLGTSQAWLQTPVYVAAGAGLVLGVLGAMAYTRRK